jgi:peptidoglycan/LPS O-acetylase OafA/YrhL
MQTRIPSLDGLRGISISLVLLSHSVLATNFPERLRFLAGLGKLGVNVFFVISGFLITTLLMREGAKSGRICLRNFYIRRILRIFPVAYLYIAVVALLSSFGLVQLGQHDLTFALSYLMDYHPDCAWIFGHFWSLTVEEQFYLFWPALIAVLGFRKSFAAAVVYIVAVQFGRIAMVSVFPGWPAALRLPQGSGAIMTGCVLAMSWEWMQARKPLFASRAFSILLVLAVGLQLYFWSIHSWAHAPGLVVSVLIGLWIFRCVEVPDDLMGKILNSRVLSYVGVLSYSIYVWQEMFLLYSPTTRTVIPWNLMTALVVATLSYYFVERPFVQLKDKFTRSTSITPPLRAATAASEAVM